MSMKGIVRYPNYKGGAGGGTKNKRKNKLAKARMEEAICIRLQKMQDEKIRNLAKSQYAKEAKEWSERYDY